MLYVVAITGKMTTDVAATANDVSVNLKVYHHFN
jgi:hypothetical protein